MQQLKLKQLKFITLLVSLVASPLLAKTNTPIAGVVSVAELKKETAKPAETKIPDIPAEYQSKFQALVIRQQRVILQLNNVGQQEQTLRQQLNDINSEGMALEKKMFDELKLDSKDFSTHSADDGLMVIQRNPKPEVDKREEKK